MSTPNTPSLQLKHHNNLHKTSSTQQFTINTLYSSIILHQQLQINHTRDQMHPSQVPQKGTHKFINDKDV